MALRKRVTNGLIAAIAVLGAAGCSDLGDVGDGNGNGAGGPDAGPGVVGQACQAQLNVSGTFEPDGTGLDEEGSCIPLGTWTLQVTVADEGDCDEVLVEDEYVYTVTEDENGYLVTYADDPEAMYSYTKITIEGECQGNFEHYSTDGLHRTYLKPYTTDDVTVIAGDGKFETYDEPQLGE